jgi:hypothetical protein
MDAIESTHTNNDKGMLNYLSDKLEKAYSFDKFAKKCREASSKLQQAGMIETKPMKRATEFESDIDFVHAVLTYIDYNACSVRVACEHFGYNRDDFYNAKRKINK